MNENYVTATLAAFLAGLTGAVGWVVTRVLGAREDAAKLEARCSLLEAKCLSLEKELGEVKAGAITQECVREVIEDSLGRRDVAAAERREAWDERLALKIEAAVLAGQTQTRAELERMVPRIVREVLHQAKPIG